MRQKLRDTAHLIHEEARYLEAIQIYDDIEKNVISRRPVALRWIQDEINVEKAYIYSTLGDYRKALTYIEDLLKNDVWKQRHESDRMVVLSIKLTSVEHEIYDYLRQPERINPERHRVFHKHCVVLLEIGYDVDDLYIVTRDFILGGTLLRKCTTLQTLDYFTQVVSTSPYMFMPFWLYCFKAKHYLEKKQYDLALINISDLYSFKDKIEVIYTCTQVRRGTCMKDWAENMLIALVLLRRILPLLPIADNSEVTRILHTITNGDDDWQNRIENEIKEAHQRYKTGLIALQQELLIEIRAEIAEAASQSKASRKKKKKRSKKKIHQQTTTQSEEVIEEEEECAICLEGGLAEAKDLCQGGHRFHEACISLWSSKCLAKNMVMTCPMCRQSITSTS